MQNDMKYSKLSLVKDPLSYNINLCLRSGARQQHPCALFGGLLVQNHSTVVKYVKPYLAILSCYSMEVLVNSMTQWPISSD